MAFKINVSHKGKALKYEVDNENLVDNTIGDKIAGSEIAPDLEGYEVEITGTSDKAGFPGMPKLKGSGLRRELLTRGRGMKDKRKGVRLRKTVRGDVISLDTVQINTKVVKEGKKKFEDILKGLKEGKQETEETIESEEEK